MVHDDSFFRPINDKAGAVTLIAGSGNSDTLTIPREIGGDDQLHLYAARRFLHEQYLLWRQHGAVAGLSWQPKMVWNPGQQ